jgi:hypothetical protein
MGGRGARFSPGTEILDPLYAQAVVLQDAQGRRVVFISVDLVEFSAPLSDQVSRDIAAALGTHPSCVLINASHTHASPMMGIGRYATLQSSPSELTAYIQSLHSILVKLAIQAAANLQEVSVTWRMGKSDIGINRRRSVDGQMLMKPNPEGAYDDSLWVLDLQATSPSGPRCLLFSHACHPVLVYGFAWNAISAEWPGKCRQSITDQLGDHVHCQFFQGLAGNVRPRAVADLELYEFRKPTPQDVIDTGVKLARDILALLQTKGDELALSLAAQRGWFSAHYQPSPLLTHWQSLLNHELEHIRASAGYWAARLSPGGIPPFATSAWPVGLVRLAADHMIAWFGGEPMAQWRKIIERALPGRRLALWGYTQDSCGYLPVDEMLPEGGYEVTGYPPLGNQSPSPLKPGLDDAASQAFIHMARRLEA